jgi:hypothetical protein
MGYDGIYLMAVKVFHKTSSDALFKAEEIATQIRKNKYTIPMLNEDGTVKVIINQDGKEIIEKIIFTKIDCSVADDNVALINLQWYQYYPFN